MRRVLPTLVATLLTIDVMATPARAATTQTAVLAACDDGFLYSDNVDVAQDASGTVHGFAAYRHSESCGNRIHYFEGSGSSWSSQATDLFGTVVGVAQDGTGTYLLHIVEEIAGTPQLVVAKRGTGGQFSRLAVLGPAASATTGEGKGDIVARNGRWLAVFPVPGEAAGDTDLYTAGTLHHGLSTAKPFITGSAADAFPALTLGADGAVTAAWHRSTATDKTVYTARTTNGRRWTQRTVASTGPYSQLKQVDVAVSTAGTFVAWAERLPSIRVQVADDLTGSWQVQAPPYEFTNGTGSWDPVLTTSGTKVAVGYSHGDEYPADSAVIAQRPAAEGSWTTSRPVGEPSNIDSYAVVGFALTGTSLTAVSVVGDTVYALSGLTL
ncbi:hypothetical protein Q0Z83_026080 [Actinoplanes sichuanensis]|uniref:Uncharacterized protein n=1 Tax=Actinoplanes sichuanensis TaxID=512349 RepID=A0ABW4AWF0_9ACTN|nr:hypothetical protein [Actinoplanes sichuanensis]BEL04417.1 hypothetical protein Q0Z83_026080 [Actinoplanes sichuanensis]